MDWPDKVKKMQAGWIGKSEGAEVVFPLAGNINDSIKIFTTTRADTLFGATYIVLAPEHPLVDIITVPDQKKEMEEYVQQSMRRSNVDRMIQNKEKTGVFTGSHAVNPANNEHIPVWVSDYVLRVWIEAIWRNSLRFWHLSFPTLPKKSGKPWVTIKALGTWSFCD